MSTSRATPPEITAHRALVYWLARVRAATDAQTLHAARHALLLAARQGAPEADLAALARALHQPMMHYGLMHTWAQTLDGLFQQRPSLVHHAADLLDALMSAWTAAGQWERARAWLDRWRALLPDSTSLAQWLHRKGSLLWMRGQWRAALRMARQAWALLTPEDVALRPSVAMLVALAAWRLGRPMLAIRWGERALAACPRDALAQQGRIHHYLFLAHLPHHLDRAGEHLARAQALLTAARNPFQLAHLWADSTDYHLARGDRTAAEEALARAYQHWRVSEDPSGLADYYRHAARVVWAMGRRALARDYAAHALERWRALGVAYEVARCQALLRAWPSSTRVLLPGSFRARQREAASAADA